MELSRQPPLPDGTLITDRWTQEFWSACQDHQLRVPYCSDCGLHRMPPTPFCPSCLGRELRWSDLSGHGIVFSYTVVRRAIPPAVEDQIPYVPAVIALQGCPDIKLISAIVDSDIERICIGAEVSVVWRPDAAGQALPFFELSQ